MARIEQGFCFSCMRSHIIETIKEIRYREINGKQYPYEFIYEFCPYTDETIETEELIRLNSKAYKNAGK